MPHVTLVHGPPASGKTTHVREHAQPGDIVIDFDLLAVALGSTDTHEHPPSIASAAAVARRSLIGWIASGRCKAERVWIVSADPAAASKIPHDELVLLDPGIDVVKKRVLNERPAKFDQWVAKWYAGNPAPTRTSRQW